MKFSTKKDLWLGLVLLFALISVPVASLWEYATGVSSQAELILAGFITLILGWFFSWIWFFTYYTITDTHLEIVSGPLRRKVALNDVLSAKLSNNPIASPALSLKRVKISYVNYKTVHISPADRTLFLSELAKKCPNARIGDV